MRILKTLTEPDLAGVNSIFRIDVLAPLAPWALPPPRALGTGHWALGTVEARREIQVQSVAQPKRVFLTCPPGVLLPPSHTRTP